MPRGGKRDGAGRKRKLSTLQRFAVGTKVLNQWRAVCEEGEDKALKAATRNVREEWDRARAERDRGSDYPFSETHSELVEEALAEDQKITDGSEPSRVITITPKRPKGPLKEIIASTAREHGLSEKMVRECLKEVRAFERDES